MCFGACLLRTISKGGSLKIRVRIFMSRRYFFSALLLCFFAGLIVQAETFTGEDFESYNDSVELNDIWSAIGSAAVTLSTDIAHKSAKSMELDFDNDSGDYYSAAKMVFDSNSDWTLDEMESISIYFRGSAGNDADKLYVVIEDDDWIPSTAAVKYDGDANDLKNEYWQRWDIDLDEFLQENPAFRLQAVSSIEIGVGDATNEQPGGTGTIYIDDITFKPVRCVDKNKAVADFDGDCDVDENDLKYLVDRWLGTDYAADLIEDMSVDFKDYKIVAGKWLDEYENWPVPLDTDNFLTPVDFTDVDITGGLWAERMETDRTVTIPHIIQKCIDTGRIDNFKLAGGLISGSHQGSYPFDDTDPYKTLEAASYRLALNYDAALDATMDEWITYFDAAMEEDGYLYTCRTNGAHSGWTGPERWSNLGSSHELYCMGHFYEAAVAHYNATGKTSLLNLAQENAELLFDTFNEDGLLIPPGHQEIEIGLMKMYHTLGDQRYFDLAKFYCDQRGNAEGHSLYGTYSQDHVPLVEQDEGVGHAVRAGYFYTGAADVARVNLDQDYMNAIIKVWNNIVNCKTYITGGLGQPGGPEGFTVDYDLGNNSYCETCASLAFAKWNHRMFLLTGDGKYLDMMEKSMHNNILSGLSLSGDHFFYPNKLESSGDTRPDWYTCACCPPHLAKYIMSIGGYAYAHNDQAVYVNLYMNGTAQIQLASNTVNLSVDTNYPWDGDVEVTVNPAQSENFPVYLRIPGWARNIPMPGNLYGYMNDCNESVTIEINGSPVEYDMVKGFARIDRVWSSGDTIELVFPMPVRKVIAHPYVTADVGLVAVQRGPVVYCAEGIDNGGSVFDLVVDEDVEFTATYEPGTLNGVTVLYGTETEITLVPYYTWANRGSTPMKVWFGEYDFDVSEGEMQGYWKLDESSGTTASDSSGKGMNGTCMNGLSFTSDSVSGVFDGAINFDGTGEYIDLPDGFADFSKGVTISVWAYPTAEQYYSRFIDLGNGSESDNILFGREGTSDNLFFEIWEGGSNGGRVVGSDAIELDKWQMFTATVDASGNTVIYKDAQVAGYGTTGVANNVTRTANYIGRSNWGADAYYQGYMDEVRVFDYAMDANGVQALYEGGRAENPSPAQGSTGISTSSLSLSWIPGAAAVKFDVYLGTDYDTVANATDTSPERVSRQSGTTYIHNSLLDPATTYFWRIDGLTDSNDVVAGKGVVWNFTTAE